MTEARIEVTEDNHWFLERQLNCFDFLELFPMDAVSPPEVGGRGVPIVLKTGFDFDIESDIDRKKMALRNRSQLHGWMRWIKEAEPKPGDTIVITKAGDRKFNLVIERGG